MFFVALPRSDERTIYFHVFKIVGALKQHVEYIRSLDIDQDEARMREGVGKYNDKKHDIVI